MDFLKARPFQIIVMAIFAVLALIGVFFFATFSGFTGGKEPIGTVVIWGTMPRDAVNEGLRDLQLSDRRFTTVSYVERPAATFDADLADAIASGEGPDLILVHQEHLIAEQNRISLIPSSSLSERNYVDIFLPITELYLTDEGTYAIPLAVDPLVLYYNRTLLAGAGAALPPSTWEAVTGLATRLSSRSSDGGIIRSAIALGEHQNITNANAIISLLLLQAGSPITQYSQNGLISSLKNTAAGYGQASAESAISFYTQFADPVKTVYSWNRAMPESRQAFLAGDTALYLGFASELPGLQAANPNLDFDIAPVPGPATVEQRVTYGRVYAFMIPKVSENRSGAYTVAIALASKAAGVLTADAASMVPAQRNAVNKGSDDRYASVFYPEALIARGWLSPDPIILDDIFGTMIGNVTSGRSTVQTALDIADASLNEALQ
jgi:ABC-type glycerol-3-phosphate transport system substrate-binding protein